MKPYNALVKKNNEGKISDVLLIKEGFSFFAFLLGPIWFFYHKMWKEAAILMVVDILFGFYADISSEADRLLLQIAFSYFVALNAIFWFCEHLKNKGYEFVDLVFASDAKEATVNFSKNLPSDSFDHLILNPQL